MSSQTRHLPAILILCVGIPIYGWIAAYDFSTLTFQDSIEYLAMADFYRSTFLGEIDPHAIAYYRETRLPPVFPLLLALVGAGTANQHAGSLLTASTTILAALSLWWWLRQERGHNVVATIVPIALLLYPAFFLLNLHPVSEPLSIAILGCVLALLCPPVSASRLVVAGMLIGLAPLVRTAMLPLIPALAIWMAIARPVNAPRRFLALAASLVPTLAWMAYRRLGDSDSYLDALTPAVLLDRLGAWPDMLWLQPQRWFLALVNNWGPPIAFFVPWLTGGLVALAFVGWAVRLRHNKLDAWFLAGYVAMILIWPFPFELGRFMVVAYPLGLVCCVSAIEEIPRLAAHESRRVQLALLWVAVTMAIIPAGTRYLHRAALPVDEALLGDKREPPFFRVSSDERAMLSAEVFARVRFLAEDAANYIPKNECAYSVHPELQRAYGKIHTVQYPLDLENVSPEVASARLRACSWFFLSGFEVAEPALPALYPHKALQGWTEAVLSTVVPHASGTVPAGLLVRRKEEVSP